MPLTKEEMAQIKTELDKVGNDLQGFFTGTKSHLGTLEEKIASIDTSLNERVDAISAALNRGGRGEGGVLMLKAERDAPEARAFRSYLAKGYDGMPEAERKLMNVSGDAAGGYLAPPYFATEVIRLMRETSALVGRCRNVQITQGEVDIPRVVSGTAANWVGEAEAKVETTMTFGLGAITLDEMGAWVELTTRLLEDNSYGVEELVLSDLALAFQQAAAAALVNGNGVKKPLGFLQDAVGATTVYTEDADDITADSLIDASLAIPAPLMAGAVWLMNRRTLGTVRKLKDGGGRFLFSTDGGLVNGVPGTLLGYPVLMDENMPNVAADAYPVAFVSPQMSILTVTKPGNSGLRILRDNITLAVSGKVRLIASMRFGAGTIRPQGIVRLRVGVTPP